MKTTILTLIGIMLLACQTPDSPTTEPTAPVTPTQPITPTDPVTPDPVVIDQTVNPAWSIGTYISDIYNLQSEFPKMIQFTETECVADLTMDGFLFANSYYFLRDAAGTAWQPLTNVSVTETTIQWTQYDIWTGDDFTFTFIKVDSEGHQISVWLTENNQSHGFGTFTKQQ